MADPKTVRDILIDALEENFEVPVYLQGSLSDEDAIPEEYFTYFVTSTPHDRHYNNVSVRAVWGIDLNFYSTDPARTFTVMQLAEPVLKQADFIVTSSGYDVPVDDPEIHTGQGMALYYIERK